jgi:hypothetical protein
LFNININTGFIFTEFVDINNTSLVDDATFTTYTDTTSAALSTTVSGKVFPYIDTKSFSVTDASTLSDSDYLRLRHSKTVTNKVAATGTATLTIASHGLSVGDIISVNSVDTSLNGLRTITAITSNTISFASSATIASIAVTGGSIIVTIYGYIITIAANTITFRVTSTTTSGSHTSWSVNRESGVSSSDQSGFILVPNTSLTWGYYENTALVWDDIESSGQSWEQYFGNKVIRYSQWLGIRQNSLGFRFYSLRSYSENGGERVPETVDINDWVFGLKPLRKGRN